MSNNKKFPLSKQVSSPTRWATFTELTSDGKSQAFISSSTYLKILHPYDKDIEWIPNYVHGTYHGVKGFFHLETRAAHLILHNEFPKMKAMYMQKNQVESNIILRSLLTFSIKGIKDKLKKKKQFKVWQHDTMNLLYSRAFVADQPNDPSQKIRRYKQMHSCCQENGRWYYPVNIYSHLLGCVMVDIDEFVTRQDRLNTNISTTTPLSGGKMSDHGKTVKYENDVDDGKSSDHLKLDEIHSVTSVYNSIKNLQTLGFDNGNRGGADNVPTTIPLQGGKLSDQRKIVNFKSNMNGGKPSNDLKRDETHSGTCVYSSIRYLQAMGFDNGNRGGANCPIGTSSYKDANVIASGSATASISCGGHSSHSGGGFSSHGGDGGCGGGGCSSGGGGGGECY